MIVDCMKNNQVLYWTVFCIAFSDFKLIIFHAYDALINY